MTAKDYCEAIYLHRTLKVDGLCVKYEGNKMYLSADPTHINWKKYGYKHEPRLSRNFETVEEFSAYAEGFMRGTQDAETAFKKE
jgi:hypothetical protein